ncbi:phosphoribosylanthranilate isomerase [Aristophania vespae]|uniref:phosphoribosylanthranilate isomerase n=1 Tax=Aristophania vespae TaxID=2697033 RepID=UPI001F44099C|nr:phosphoribosylanthranilate isomerase [Aristophania vespae]
MGGVCILPPSPRSISADHAQILHKSAPSSHEGGPKRVGLFVKPTFEDVEKILRKVNLDILQLYTSTEQAELFRKQFNIPVWQAKGIDSLADLPTQKTLIDGYVIEAPSSSKDSQPGGLGRTFDWTLTEKWHSPAPWLLAGGLTPENVSRAIKISKAQAVDVSSGVESSKGIKSLEKIEKFVLNALNGVA